PSMRLSSASMRLQHSAQLGLATGMSSSRHVLYTKDDTEELGEDNGIPLPTTVPLTDDSDVEEVTVTREPNQKSLGFSVISEVGELKVGRVIVDSPCHDQLRVGDRLLAVNDLQVAGLSPEELFSRLEQAPELTFKVRRASVNGNAAPSIEHLRAPYDYDASKDCQCPCKSAGLAFKQGDIIRVLNKSDRNWWQGRVLQADGSMGPSWHFPGAQVSEKALKIDIRPWISSRVVTLQDSGHRPNLLSWWAPARAVGMSCRPPSVRSARTSSLSQSCHTSRLRRPEEAEAAGFSSQQITEHSKEFQKCFVKAGECGAIGKPRTAAAASTGIDERQEGDGQRPSLRAGRCATTAWRPCGAAGPPLMPSTDRSENQLSQLVSLVRTPHLERGAVKAGPALPLAQKELQHCHHWMQDSPRAVAFGFRWLLRTVSCADNSRAAKRELSCIIASRMKKFLLTTKTVAAADELTHYVSRHPAGRLPAANENAPTPSPACLETAAGACSWRGPAPTGPQYSDMRPDSLPPCGRRLAAPPLADDKLTTAAASDERNLSPSCENLKTTPDRTNADRQLDTPTNPGRSLVAASSKPDQSYVPRPQRRQAPQPAQPPGPTSAAAAER
uniref:SH3 domain-containing protein n=1 Tax=Macrostomum lignano TaxID=282301 RepID=A0A1I8FEA3_9PLAT